MNDSERHFAAAVLNKRLVLPTFNEDVNQHWDLKVDGFSYDVKSAKKVKRSDSEVNFSFHWVELKNVNGKQGWLYGKADYIAFEAQFYWLCVRRETLKRAVEALVEDVFELEFPLFKKYQRRGRKDVISLIPTELLFTLAEKIYKK